MPRWTDKLLLAFNRGVISSIGLARIDLERMAMSAAQQRNWMPRVLGSMMLRPGLEFLDQGFSGSGQTTKLLPFTFGVDDTALLEMGDGVMSVRVDDVRQAVDQSVTATIANPAFTSNIASWTDASDSGGTAAWVSGGTGYAGLSGDGTDFGILRQTVTLNESGVEHYIAFFIEDGPVRIKIGSTVGDDDYFDETRLDRGTHYLSFTPTTDFTVEIANEREFVVLVDAVWVLQQFSGLTFFQIVTPWDDTDLPNLRWDQSGDVIYVACDGIRTTKIERRGDGRSWGVAQYLPEDGPFRRQNVSGITMQTSALTGDVTISSSAPVFRQEHADERALFRIASQGQNVTKSISSQNDFTDSIRVVGVEAARTFGLVISGRSDSTITLQFSFDDATWNDTSPQFTADTSESYEDGQDEQIIYYRLGIKTGDYGTDTVQCSLNYTSGSIQGVARIQGFTSSINVQAQVLKAFGATGPSKDWWEGEWSDRRGWPTAVSLYEGRLWWAGLDKIWGSISDAFESFDDNQVGDAGPISRSIGFGPQRVIHWLIGLGRLMFGTSENSANVLAAKMDGNHPLSARSNSFDEPLTPTNFNIKTISSRGVFVDRTLQRLYELIYDIDQQDYKSLDLSVFAPDYNKVGIVHIAVQMKPDIRIHCVRSDGTVGILVYDRLENVICWCEVDSTAASGIVENVAVLPGTVEDQVYYVVKRTINSLTERHICKWALESQAIGGTDNRIADSFVVYSGGATTTPFTTELLHLRDETVEVWADGADVGTHTVSATGALTLTTAASDVIAGLGYTAQFKSAKLAEIGALELLEHKKVTRLGFIAENLHHLGLQYGPSFDASEMYDLPQEVRGQIVATDTVHSDYHEEDFAFGGEWDPDSRICLQAAAPRPATVLAALALVESVEKQRTSQRRRS